MAVTQAQAAKHLLKLKKAQNSFVDFVKLCNPEMTFAPFQIELMETLDKLAKGTLGKNKLLITMPPRHAKSFIATVHFPVFYLASKPTRNVLSTSYNQDLSKTFGRQVRDLAREQLVEQAFPDFKMSDESRAVDDWRTSIRWNLLCHRYWWFYYWSCRYTTYP